MSLGAAGQGRGDVHRGQRHQVPAAVALDHGLGVLEQRAEADGAPGAGEAEIAERDGERLDVVGIEQHEQLARLVAIDEDVGAAAAAQQAGEGERAVRVEGDVAELDDLGLAVGLEQQRGVGAVEHGCLGHALQPGPDRAVQGDGVAGRRQDPLAAGLFSVDRATSLRK
jgi:hypothetical protein